MATNPNLPQFKQGETEQITLIVLDEKGAAVDCSDTQASDVHILLSQGQNQVAQYSRVSKTGYAPVTVGGTANNELTFWITREQSKTFSNTLVKAIVLVEEIEGQSPSGSRYREFAYDVAVILEGLGKDEAI